MVIPQPRFPESRMKILTWMDRMDRMDRIINQRKKE
jgi:hypothetical protein